MILLAFDKTMHGGARIVVLFGSGLIGGAIAGSLRRESHYLHDRRLAWTWPQARKAEVQTVERAVFSALEMRPSSGLTVIWAAGRSGFGSSEDDMDQEYLAFSDVRRLARRWALACGPNETSFLHISSAGGLFEGQVACGHETPPFPIRPYGHGKLKQETSLHEDIGLGYRLIIRPSSVYGYVAGGRHGLVSALVSASLQRREAKIFGAMKTQRDYLFAPDIGRYVAERVFAQKPKSTEAESVVLASGRPASVFEIIKIVEDCTGNPLYLKIDPRPDNARDNTFRPSVTPFDFHPTPLREGIGLTKTAIMEFAH